MKAFTSIEQSKKLAEILPLITADMDYIPIVNLDGEYSPSVNVWDNEHIIDEGWIPAWSLASLLENIPQVKLDNIKQCGKKHWRCCAYFASDWHNSDWCDNPVDACYELILKLNELNLL